LLEPFAQPIVPVRGAVGISRPIADPDYAIADFDRRSGYVIGPRIERAAGCKIEAGMVPVAGQDAVLDRPAVQRKTQVRATVIEREHAAVVVHDHERAVRPRRDDHRLCAQFLEGTNADELTFRHRSSLLAGTSGARGLCVNHSAIGFES
jgi:hypothetical protein